MLRPSMNSNFVSYYLTRLLWKIFKTLRMKLFAGNFLRTDTDVEADIAKVEFITPTISGLET